MSIGGIQISLKNTEYLVINSEANFEVLMLILDGKNNINKWVRALTGTGLEKQKQRP